MPPGGGWIDSKQKYHLGRERESFQLRHQRVEKSAVIARQRAWRFRGPWQRESTTSRRPARNAAGTRVFTCNLSACSQWGCRRGGSGGPARPGPLSPSSPGDGSALTLQLLSEFSGGRKFHQLPESRPVAPEGFSSI